MECDQLLVFYSGDNTTEEIDGKSNLGPVSFLPIDLHYRTLPYIAEMLENAWHDYDTAVQAGKSGDMVSYFNVPVRFPNGELYNARLVIKHFGENKNYYDHKLTEFEALSIQRLRSEEPGPHDNASGSNITDSGEKSSEGAEYSLSRKPVKNPPEYQRYLDRKIADGTLSVSSGQRSILEQFYQDFPLGKEIVNKLGEHFYFQPLPGGNLNDYIHHFAVKRTQAGGVYKESFSEKFMRRFQDIEDTIRNYDRRILGMTTAGQPRLYFYRKLDKNHVAVVASDPDGRLLPWTHFEPTDSYVTHRLLEPEKQLIATYDIVDQNGKYYSPEEYERLKEDIPLYLATAEGSSGLLPQAANPMADSNITDSGDKSSPKSEFSLNRKPRQQVNPIISNEDIRREYAEELGRSTYTPETVAEWDRKAVDWITRQGGVAGAVEAILHDTEHNDRHVASLVRRHVMNSDVFAKLDEDSRAKLETHHAFTGTEWGREGVARRLAALTLDSVAKVRALFDKLHADLPDKEKTELRNKVLDETGVDIFKLPKDIAENRRKLDAVLRSELAARSSRGDQLYEFWINSILSGPATHVRNVAGNTLNTAYELGPKRAVEAAINVAVRNPKGATFGEMPLLL